MKPGIESYQTSEAHVPFLRIETPRDRVALPYAMLLGLTLSNDETTLVLNFASSVVTIQGRRLYEVFCAISSGRGEALFARNCSDDMVAVPLQKAPFISAIRVREVEEEAISSPPP